MSEEPAAGMPMPEPSPPLGAEEFERIQDDATPVIKTLSARARTKAWNPEEYSMQTQARLAFRLIWVLVGVLVGGAAMFTTTRWTGLMTKDVTAFFGIAFGAVVTLTTAATSFWFGSLRSGRPSSPSPGADHPPLA